jgi:hypothetical protein
LELIGCVGRIVKQFRIKFFGGLILLHFSAKVRPVIRALIYF